MSCAVVGSSGSLLGSGLGPEIDAADAVVRFNAAPTEGFQADVGARTSIRFINGVVQRGSGCAGTSTTMEDLVRVTSGHGLVCKPCGRAAFDSAASLYGPGAAWISALQRRALRAVMIIARSRRVDCPRPGLLSLGALAAVLASEVTSKTTLYGFGFHSEDPADLHYWEAVEGDISAHHDYAAERRMISGLEAAGRLRARTI